MWAVNTGVKCGCGCVCVVGMGVDVATETRGEAHEHVCAHAEGESHLRDADVEYTDRAGVWVCGCVRVRVCGCAGVWVCGYVFWRDYVSGVTWSAGRMCFCVRGLEM